METNSRVECWWDAERSGRPRHQDIMPHVNYLEQQNRGLREDAVFHMMLVSNFSPTGNGEDGNYWRWRAGGQRMRCNLTASACDTAAGLILQGRTVPFWLTNDGDFQLSRVAEQRSRAIQGQFHKLGVFDLCADVGVDALQTGTGHLLGYVERDERGRPQPKLERILPNEILVDAVDGQYRDPRSIYRQKLISREQLMALYPKHREKLKDAGGPTPANYVDLFIRRDNRADFVRVVEAWHLPSGKGKNDGRHTICTDNCDLVDEPYNKPRFPIRTYRYVERRVGYWGQGLVERVTPAQVRLSELQQAKRDMQRLCSNAYWVTHRNANVTWEDLTNLPGQQLEWDGQVPPAMVVFEGTPGDLSMEEAQIKQEVWEQEGFAGSITQGEVNKGLSSARAVRAADDVASRRHVMPTRLYENLYLEVTQLIEDLNDECAEIDPNYSVTARYRSGRKVWLKNTKWTELKLPEGAAQINVFPISALPTTPMGMWSALEEMIQAGMVGRNMAMDLQQLPDVSQYEQLENSSLDFTRWQIDMILDGTPDVLPVPFQDIALAKTLATQCRLMALRSGAPEEIDELFEIYLAHCKNLEELANPAPVAAPIAMNPAAQAAAAMNAQAAPAAPMPQPMAA